MAKQTTIRKRKIVDIHHKPTIIEIQDSKGNTISLEAQFPYEIRENEKSWIAYSPHFKTFGYSSKSELSATKDLKIAIDTFFEVHTKRGTLEKALIEFGWLKQNNVFQKPKLFNTPIRRGAVRRDLNLKDFPPSVALAVA